MLYLTDWKAELLIFLVCFLLYIFVKIYKLAIDFYEIYGKIEIGNDTGKVTDNVTKLKKSNN